MTLSVNQIRTMCGPLLEGFPHWLAASATSGDLAYLKALELISGFGPGFYKGGWVIRTAKTNNDRVREISAYSPDDGTITVTPSWAAAVTTDAFEVWSTFNPVLEVEAAAIRAMRKLRIPEITEFSGVANQRQYDLQASPTSLTWFVNSNQFVRLELRSTDSANEYTYRTITPPEFTMDQGVVVMNLVGATYTATDTLRLTAHRSAESAGSVVPLAAGADTVPLASDQGYLTLAALLAAREVLKRGMQRRLDGPSNAQRQNQIAELSAEIRQWRRTFKLDEPRSIFAPQRRAWGPGVISWM